MFFFFQAEDGIRDHCVTGVQTCALPISGMLLAAVGHNEEGAAEGSLITGAFGAGVGTLVGALLDAHRSEERRVGKECGSGWRADHRKPRRETIGVAAQYRRLPV